MEFRVGGYARLRDALWVEKPSWPGVRPTYYVRLCADEKGCVWKLQAARCVAGKAKTESTGRGPVSVLLALPYGSCFGSFACAKQYWDGVKGESRDGLGCS